MSHWFHEMRRHIHPRAGFSAWGRGRPVLASDIILCMTLVMLLVALVAYALTHLFTAA